jgi:ABC-type Mn2+/Zn2+ transport system ATPase subunit
MTEAPALEVRSMEAGYTVGVRAISGIDFGAEPGQVIAVLGPNGGGKTTLYRAILDEMPWRRGSVEVRGEVAYVPQTDRSRLDFPVSALDVTLMGTYASLAPLRRIGRAQRERARDALGRVGLLDFAGSRFGELSGGQRQRVLIARALARDARVLLLDEPLSGVDEASSRRILEIVSDLRDEGRTLLVATHDINQARAFDAVLCINAGQVAFGPPDVTLSPPVLERTYGGELIQLDDGSRAVLVDHHSH